MVADLGLTGLKNNAKQWAISRNGGTGQQLGVFFDPRTLPGSQHLTWTKADTVFERLWWVECQKWCILHEKRGKTCERQPAIATKMVANFMCVGAPIVCKELWCSEEALGVKNLDAI